MENQINPVIAEAIENFRKGKKLKTYVIMVSRTYPAYHHRKGQPTYFVEKIQLALNMLVQVPDYLLIDLDPKIHTFRGNFPLWKKRIDEVLSGNAVIVLKYHTLGRYVKGNKQIEFVRLDKDSGVGVQEFLFGYESASFPTLITGERVITATMVGLNEVSENDGLLSNDFKEWFEKGDYDMNEAFACIHFTSFRYGRTLPTPK